MLQQFLFGFARSSRPVKPEEPGRIYTTRGCCVCREVDCSCTCCLQPPPKLNVQAQTSEYFLREKGSQTPQKSKCCRCCRCCRNRGKNNCLNCPVSKNVNVEGGRLDSRNVNVEDERLDSRNVSVEDERLDSRNASYGNEYAVKRTGRVVPEKDSTLMTRTHCVQCSISEETPPSKISDFVEGLFAKKYQVGDFRTPCPKDLLGAYRGAMGNKGVRAFESHFTKQIERLEEKINALARSVNSGCGSTTNPSPEPEIKEAPDSDVRFIYERKDLNQEESKGRAFLDHCDLSFPPCGGGLEEGGENLSRFFVSSVSDPH